MRLVFAGTPAAALPSLATLADGEHRIELVITRPDAEIGRHRIRTPSAVAAAATARGIPVLKTGRLDQDATDRVRAAHPDLGVIVAFGALVREPLLSVPRLGWINLHFSLLPAWRGAAPVQRSIMAGDHSTGATVFRLVPELDAGDILGITRRPTGPDETAGEVLEALAESGAQLLADVVAELADGTATSIAQAGAASLAAKLTIDDARIDWDASGQSVYDRIRAVSPEPGAFTTVHGNRVKILKAHGAPDATALPAGRIRSVHKRILAGTATHPVELLSVQPSGKRPMPAADWWRGISADEVDAR
ncbi:MAG: methionyl-tRNA formyltransferase [Microbacteriaceae bacterium]